MNILPEPGAGVTVSPVKLATSLDREDAATLLSGRVIMETLASGLELAREEKCGREHHKTGLVGFMEVTKQEQRGPPGGGEEESTSGCMSQLPQVLVTEPEARLGWQK